jgi:quinol monooxygenase YgiN
MILVTLSVFSPPGRREEMVEVFWTLLGPVRVEPGCLSCGLFAEICNGEGLLYVEEWETAEQLERHMRSARYERLLAVMEASARPPVLRYHTVSGSMGMEYLQAVRLGAAACPPPCPPPASGEGWEGKAAAKDRP